MLVQEVLVYVRKRCAVGLFLLACLDPSTAWAGQPKQIDLTWEDLNYTVLGRKVTMFLPPGVEIRGKVTEIQPDGLVVDIKKSSDRSAYPKGRTLIARSSIRVFQMRKFGKRWRIVGTITGGVLGLGMAGLILIDNFPVCFGTKCESNSAAGGAALGALAGITAGGYYLGKAADRKAITVRIIKNNETQQRPERTEKAKGIGGGGAL